MLHSALGQSVQHCEQTHWDKVKREEFMFALARNSYTFFTSKPPEVLLTERAIDSRIATIVFDIDKVLTDAYQFLPEEDRLYFLRKSGIIPYNHTLYPIVAGIPELMRYLYAQTDVEIIYFSGGEKERNQIFIHGLLQLALEQTHYNHIKNKVKIFSRDNLLEENGVKKKELTQVLNAQGRLENTVLIDDISHFVAEGQQQCYLYSEAMIDFYGDRFKEPVKRRFDDDLFNQFNATFYIAGVLSQCLLGFRKGQSIVEALSQIKEKSRRTYYDTGLEVLQKKNPDISFVDFNDYHRFNIDSPTVAEQKILTELEEELQKRDKGWCIVL